MSTRQSQSVHRLFRECVVIFLFLSLLILLTIMFSGCSRGGGGGSVPLEIESAGAEARTGLRDDVLVVTSSKPLGDEDGRYRFEHPVGVEVSLAGAQIEVLPEERLVVLTLSGQGSDRVDLVEGESFALTVSDLQGEDGSVLAMPERIEGIVSGSQALLLQFVGVEARPDLADDVVRVRFSKPIDPLTALDSSRYLLEHPRGTVFSLEGSSAVYEPDSLSVRLTLDGTPSAPDRILPGEFYRVTPRGILSEDGAFLGDGESMAGEVSGQQALLATASARAFPGYFDDQITVEFTKDVDADSVLDSSRYSLEMPPGLPVPLSTAAFSFDPSTRKLSLTFSLPGALSMNFPSGSPFRLAVDGLTALDGTSLPPGLFLGGEVFGVNAPPVLSSTNPETSGTQGGIDITLRGSGLTHLADTVVSVGGSSVEELTRIDGETFRLRLGRGAPGKADIQLQNSNGQATLVRGIDFVLPFPMFAGVLSVPVEEGPVQARSGDVNGDGVNDVVVVNSASNSLLILERTPSLDFGQRGRIRTGENPRDVCLADLNEDGLLDLVNTCRLSSSVEVRLNTGAGFRRASSIEVLSRPEQVEAGDLNSDGRKDLVVASRSHPGLTILLSTGNGTFLERVDRLIPDRPTGLVLADVDEDGDLDVATSNELDSVTLLLNDGLAGFTSSNLPLPEQSIATGIAATMLGTEGRVDLVTSDLGSGNVSLLYGRGDGTFNDALSVVPLPPITPSGINGAEPIEIAAGPLKNDSSRSLLVGLRAGFGVSILEFQPGAGLSEIETIRTGEEVEDVEIITSDPGVLPEILSVHRESETISLVKRKRNGGFLKPRIVDLQGGAEESAVGDFNEDGRQDVVVVSSRPSSVQLLLGDGRAAFEPRSPVLLSGRPVAVRSEDLTGDGHLDLLVLDRAEDAVFILAGDGAGSFGPPSRVGRADFAFDVGDVDGDGDLDVIVSLFSGIRIGLNDGAGNFSPGQEVQLGFRALDFAVNDFDSDGNLDLGVVGTLTQNDIPQSGRIGVVFGNGRGGFGNGSFLALSRFEVASSVALLDANGDGRVDLAAVETGSRPGDDAESRIHLVLGDGTRTLVSVEQNPTRHRIRSTGGQPGSLLPVDVDLDGTVDLALTSRLQNRLQIFLNGGTGSLREATGYAVGKGANHLSTGDFDGNGTPDLIVVETDHGTLSVLLRRG